jgi:hypothetical protein
VRCSCNDFLSEGSKLWPWADIAEEVNLLDNLRTIGRTAREVGIKIFMSPHHRWEPGRLRELEISIEHRASSGFSNTDLDHQLKHYGMEKIIMIGLWRTPALRRMTELAWNSAISLRCCGTAQRRGSMKRCMPHSLLMVRASRLV